MAIRAQAPSLAEALDATNLTWTTGGDADWFGQTTNSYDGTNAAATILSGPNQTSWLETTVVGPATLSYWSEMMGATTFHLPPASYLTFAISPGFGSGPGPGQMGGWWGTWQNAVYDLPAGTNVLRWTFHTSAYATNGATGAFLDQVVLGPARPLQITDQSGDETVFERQWVGLYVSAVGTPPLAYQWFKDGTNLAGATNASLYFASVSTNDSGVYSVVVSNATDFAVSTNAVLTVLPPAPPSLPWPLGDMTVYSGQSVLWSVWADGSPPFAYQWLKDGTNLPGATAASLSLTNVQLSDAGVYSIQVTNTEGSIVSSNAVLTVIPSAAPVITAQPCSLNVAAGACPVLSVEASGAPTPQYQWLKNGTNLPGAHYSSLSFSNIAVADAGLYAVRVSNLAGSVLSRQAILIVLPAPNPRGSWPQPVNSVFVTNNLAYVVQGGNSVAILDVSNPDNPSQLGACSISGQASAVQVAGGLAYVAAGFSGLQILTVTNPAASIQIGTYDTSGYAQNVSVAGSRAYVADGSAGLQILDVSDPAHPFRLGGFVTNMSAASVWVAGNLAYVGCGSVASLTNNPMYPGLQILDITDPAQPALLATTTSDADTVGVSGNVVLTAGLDSSLTLFDVSRPTAPVRIGYYSPPIFGASFPPFPRVGLSVWDLCVAGNLAYAAAGSDGLWVLDVSISYAPVAVARFGTAGFAQGVAVAGNRAYVALGDGGLQIIDLPAGLGVQPAPALSLSAANGLKLRLNGPTGARFAIETVDNLTGVWQPFETLTLSNSPAVLDVSPTPAGQRFFRARPLQPW